MHFKVHRQWIGYVNLQLTASFLTSIDKHTDIANTNVTMTTPTPNLVSNKK